MAKSLLKEGGLPNQFWGEAVATSVYLLNLSPTKAVQNRTPLEAWKGMQPTVSHLHIFGCIAYTLIPSPQHQKLDKKPQKCIFIGYSIESKAYKLYNPVTCKVIISRDVIFNEDAKSVWSEDKVPAHQTIPLESIEVASPTSNSPAINSSNSASQRSQSSPSNSHASPSNSNGQTESSSSSATVGENSSTRSISTDESPIRRVCSLKEIYETCDFALTVSDPTSYEEAVEKDEWRQAMQDELLAIQRNKTWDLVPLSKDKQAIGLKWVFKTKFGLDGSVQRHKAWLVAKGYSQMHGVDFDETFFPVARFEIVRLFLVLAAQQQWPVYQLDVKSAFLNGELQEEVYVEQP